MNKFFIHFTRGFLLRLRVPALGLAILWLTTCFAVHADTLATNAVAPLTNTLPDASSSLFRVFGALVLVIAIFLGGVWLFKNWQRFTVQKGGGAKLNLIEVKSLGQRQSLYVVGYQQQRMLIASSPAGITLVSHLPEATDAETAATSPSKISFAEAFQQVLSGKK